MRRTSAALVIVLALVAGTGPASAQADPDYRRIHFPVEGAVTFADDYGAPRSGGRSHEGNDLMGTRLQKLLSTVDGKVTFLRGDGSGNAGNLLTITDADGWSYSYMHINNDSPGTDDGANPAAYRFAPGIAVGSRIAAGQFVAYLGDSGNAEGTAPHLHFEIRRPDRTAINPWTSLRLARGLPAGTRCGYPTNPLARPSVRSGAGYWVLTADGGVFSFGAARFLGSTGGIRLNKPIVGMASTPTGNGYWLVASDGGIFAFGDARFSGSTGAIRLNQPINGMATTPTGKGYWLIASDGGMFAFGDARFLGSVPGLGVATTVLSMAATATGAGYWLLAADGGVFAFGDAAFHGSLPGSGLCQPPRGIRLVRTATGRGYWVQADDGSTWSFGDAVDHGSLKASGLRPVAPIIDLAVAAPAA